MLFHQTLIYKGSHHLTFIFHLSGSSFLQSPKRLVANLKRVPARELQPDEGVDQLGDAQSDVGFTVGVTKLELPLFKLLADQIHLCEVFQGVIKQSSGCCLRVF